MAKGCLMIVESMFYAMRRMQPKKRKIVDRRASKSRKIRCISLFLHFRFLAIYLFKS